jgi:hypothetical protein
MEKDLRTYNLASLFISDSPLNPSNTLGVQVIGKKKNYSCGNE